MSNQRTITEDQTLLVLGYDEEGSYMVPPSREEDMEVLLFKRKDGTFFLHKTFHDDEGNPLGNSKWDLSPEDAFAWWVKQFVPEEMLPLLLLKRGKG